MKSIALQPGFFCQIGSGQAQIATRRRVVKARTLTQSTYIRAIARDMGTGIERVTKDLSQALLAAAPAQWLSKNYKIELIIK